MTTKFASASTRETGGQINGRAVLVTLGPDDIITLRPKGIHSGVKVSVAALVALAEKYADRKPGVVSFKLERPAKAGGTSEVPPVPTALTQP